MARQDWSDPLSPFGGDPFKIQREPKGGTGKPRSKPAAAPEARALYDLQTDLLKALSALENEEYEGKALKPLRNGYKIVNRYLRQYAKGEDEGGMARATDL